MSELAANHKKKQWKLRSTVLLLVTVIRTLSNTVYIEIFTRRNLPPVLVSENLITLIFVPC